MIYCYTHNLDQLSSDIRELKELDAETQLQSIMEREREPKLEISIRSHPLQIAKLCRRDKIEGRNVETIRVKNTKRIRPIESVQYARLTVVHGY